MSFSLLPTRVRRATFSRPSPAGAALCRLFGRDRPPPTPARTLERLPRPEAVRPSELMLSRVERSSTLAGSGRRQLTVRRTRCQSADHRAHNRFDRLHRQDRQFVAHWDHPRWCRVDSGRAWLLGAYRRRATSLLMSSHLEARPRAFRWSDPGVGLSWRAGRTTRVSRFHDVQRPDDQSGNRPRDRET